MDNWSNCPLCYFARDTLLEVPCCQAMFCYSCLETKGRCPKCYKTFDISKCFECKPMETLVKEVLHTCKHPGCGYQTTEFLISQHESICKHASILDSELAEALMGPTETPKAVAVQRKKNIFTPFMMYNNVKHILDCMERDLPLDETPLPSDNQDGEDFFTHIILESDTLAGLAVKYRVSTVEIKEANHMCSDQIHERTALRIPRRTEPTFTEADAKGLEKLLIQRLVNRFRRRTNIKTNEEALYYLENANMEMEKAYLAWVDDNEWEKDAPPFKSSIPIRCAHEELELFEKAARRSCCFLVL